MLESIAPGLWHAQHHFRVKGLPLSSRMTVVRLRSGGLWLHSPVPLAGGLQAAIAVLGQVEAIVAPNKAHHLFAGDCARAFPEAVLYGAPGLAAKRPDLPGLRALPPAVPDAWADDFDQVFIAGIPILDETWWLHKPSGSLVVTDICQWMRGAQPFGARLYAHLVGVRRAVAVPRTVRLAVRDRAAVRASIRHVLDWPVRRLVLGHDAIVDRDASLQLERALACFSE
jgi:hypothetical protein